MRTVMPLFVLPLMTAACSVLFSDGSSTDAAGAPHDAADAPHDAADARRSEGTDSTQPNEAQYVFITRFASAGNFAAPSQGGPLGLEAQQIADGICNTAAQDSKLQHINQRRFVAYMADENEALQSAPTSKAGWYFPNGNLYSQLPTVWRQSALPVAEKAGDPLLIWDENGLSLVDDANGQGIDRAARLLIWRGKAQPQNCFNWTVTQTSEGKPYIGLAMRGTGATAGADCKTSAHFLCIEALEAAGGQSSLAR